MLEFAITNEIGPDVDPPGHEVYFADLTINGEPYDLELPEERPLTVDDDRVQNPDAYFQTIQGAIDCAIAGDTISVATGTYEEDLTVNIPDLTLQSETGKANTTIQLVDDIGIDIQGGANGFTLGGSEGHGFTIDDSASTTFNIQLPNAPSDVEISHNKIISDSNGSKIILNVGAAGISGLTVSNNEFTAEDGDGSIWCPDGVNVSVLDNKFTGPATPTLGYAVEFSGASGVLIDGNEITNYTNGVFVFSAAPSCGTSTVSNVTISNSTIMGCTNGIRLGHSTQTADMTTVTVTYNYISGSTKAITIANSPYVKASTFVINYNALIGSSTYGLENLSAEQVTAECNWWGGVAGPQHPSNPYEFSAEKQNNDEVSNNVDYIPWLIQVELVEGWNIVSWPISSDWGEEGEPPEEMEALYYFDSSTQHWGYDPEDAGPLDAMYVKVTAPLTVSACISSEATFPAQKEMKRGWNLVGLAELHPMLVDDALVDAYYGTGEADLVGYSRVISPPLHQPNWSFLRDSVPACPECVEFCAEEYCADCFTTPNPEACMKMCMRECIMAECPPLLLKLMYPTKGYWVYMVNDGWLGGFTSTPIVPLEP